MVSIHTLYSQDVRSPKPVININDVLLGFSPKFVKAWNWASIDRRLDSALSINFYHRNTYNSTWNAPQDYEFPNNQWRLQAFHGQKGIGGGDKEYSMLQAPAIEFNPAITFYTQTNFDPNNFIPIDNDSNGSVFGFKQIDIVHGSIPSTGVNKNSYVLNKNGITTPIDILSQPWPDDEMIGMFENIQYMDTAKNRNGKEWFLTINLRSLETINISNENLPILTLKVPYYLYNNQTKYYINFNNEPSDGLSTADTATLYSNRVVSDRRGFTRTCKNKSTNFQEIVITGKMLKVNSAGLADSNITLSGKFLLYGDTLENNHSLQTGEEQSGKLTTRISHLGLEVKYHGNINIAINYFRYETPYGQSILRGQQDSVFSDSLRVRMNMLRNLRPGLKIYRFYGIDEFWVENWLSHRYFNKLVNGMGCSEIDHPVHTKLFEHCVNFPEFWRGRTFTIDPAVAAPYIKNTNRFYDSTINSNFWRLLPEVFNYSNGYYGFWKTDANHLKDTINSGYETFIKKQYGLNGYWQFDFVNLPLNESVNIFDHLDYSPNPFYLAQSTQMNFETALYNINKSSSFLFASKNWWANVWSSCESWKGGKNPDSIYYRDAVGTRAKTGEELRFQAFSPIILGAKGLIYWWGVTDTSFSQIGGASYGLATFPNPDPIAHSTLPTGINLLRSDLIGGDYIQYPLDSSFTKYVNTNNILFSTLGHDENHIYVGRKSVRCEVYKINKWINENETLLLNLKLVSWLGKGYMKWISNNPDYQLSRPFDSFVNSLAISTRPIDRVDNLGNAFYEQTLFTPPDSGFYDITIHKDVTRSIDSVFYIFTQNRRTDPLFRDPYHNNGQMTFVPTAEFDKLVVNGGNLHLKPWWQIKWWMRQGSREITYKFKLPESFKNKLVKVTELGLSYQALREIHRFSNDTLNDAELANLYPRYNNIVGYNGSVTAKYLPGEAKLYRCEIIDDDDPLSGNLANSNQSKLITYPVLDAQGNETGKIQYHLVYFKPDPNDNNRIKVYYSRSEPLDSINTLGTIDPMEFPNDPRYSQNIIWQTFNSGLKRFCISDNFLNLNNIPTNVTECDYPALVVRKDDTQLKAYIIYTCNDLASNGYSTLNIASVNVTDPYSDPSVIVNRQIERLSTPQDSITQTYSTRSQWGTPTINASSNGVYYAWSTFDLLNPPSNPAIRVAYAPPSDGLPTRIMSIINPTFNYGMTTIGNKMKFPSMNTYSNISNGEDNCTLTWVCRFDNSFWGTGYQLLYTNIRLNQQGQIYNYSPNFNLSSITKKYILMNNTNTIAMLGVGGNHSYPVNYRLLYSFNINSDYLKMENIISQVNSVNGGLNKLSTMQVIPIDNNNQPTSIIHAPTSGFIYNIGGDITQPDVCQSTAYYYDGFKETPAHQFSIMNCNINNTIYQSLFYYNSNLASTRFFTSLINLVTQGYRDLELFSQEYRLVGSGILSHLAKSPNSNHFSPWKNRRVYNDGEDILNSAKYFFMLEPDAMPSTGYLGYSSDSGSVFLSETTVDDYYLTYILPFDSTAYQGKSLFYFNGADTIKTDWFSIDADAMLNFKTFGLDSNYKVILEYDDGYKVELNVPTIGQEDTCYFAKYNLLMGDAWTYRLLLVNLDTNRIYKERVILGNMPVKDTINKQINLFRQLANDVPKDQLNHREIKLSIIPNPAKEEIYATVSMPSRIASVGEGDKPIVLTIFGLNGNELIRLEVTEGTTRIPIKDLPQGSYLIRAEGITGKSAQSLTPITQTFIIQR